MVDRIFFFLSPLPGFDWLLSFFFSSLLSFFFWFFWLWRCQRMDKHGRMERYKRQLPFLRDVFSHLSPSSFISPTSHYIALLAGALAGWLAGRCPVSLRRQRLFLKCWVFRLRICRSTREPRKRGHI